jgi:purine-binding chemotaxis protein CheW
MSTQHTSTTDFNQLLRDSTHTAGKYLTFKLSKEQYGIDILKVTEIIGVVDITRVPNCPPHVLGVVNLRGKIIPLVDLRLRFRMAPVPYDDKTCIIVTSVKTNDTKLLIGMVVDTVVEVVCIPPERIASPPEYGTAVETSSIIGMGKLNDNDVAILLDLDKVLDLTQEAL